MNTLQVHRSYCTEHSDNSHWLDENGQCYGDSLAAVERHGYTYARHVGGGWFELRQTYSNYQQDLAWQMAAEAHDSALAPYYEPDF